MSWRWRGGGLFFCLFTYIFDIGLRRRSDGYIVCLVVEMAQLLLYRMIGVFVSSFAFLVHGRVGVLKCGMGCPGML